METLSLAQSLNYVRDLLEIVEVQACLEMVGGGRGWGHISFASDEHHSGHNVMLQLESKAAVETEAKDTADKKADKKSYAKEGTKRKITSEKVVPGTRLSYYYVTAYLG